MSTKHLTAEITQSAIILLKGKLLILELTNHPWKWVFPGGRINQWESRFDGLKREIKEEINRDDLMVKNVVSIDNRETKNSNQFGIFYVCSIWSDEIRLSDEHSNFHWIWIDENLDKFDFYHPFLKELTQYTLREQNIIDSHFFQKK